MNLDGLRGYLQLATGLTDVTRERARAAARSLLTQGESVVPTTVRHQVSTLAEDLLATSKANRELLAGLVRAEVDRSVARLGLVSAEEVERATRRAQSLERRVAELERELAARRGGSSSAGKSAAKQSAKRTAKRTATKPAKKTAAKKSSTRKTSATKTTATGGA